MRDNDVNWRRHPIRNAIYEFIEFTVKVRWQQLKKIPFINKLVTGKGYTTRDKVVIASALAFIQLFVFVQVGKLKAPELSGKLEELNLAQRRLAAEDRLLERPYNEALYSALKEAEWTVVPYADSAGVVLAMQDMMEAENLDITDFLLDYSEDIDLAQMFPYESRYPKGTFARIHARIAGTGDHADIVRFLDAIYAVSDRYRLDNWQISIAPDGSESILVKYSILTYTEAQPSP